MKVKFVGFGGYLDTPCYEDENGNLYFDNNHGRNGLCLYTGAYRDEYNDICGESCTMVKDEVECDDPYEVNPNAFKYSLLDRLRLDCNYYINRNGKCRETSLWADIDTIIAEMTNILESFSDDEKPEWLTASDFEELKNKIARIKEERANDSVLG